MEKELTIVLIVLLILFFIYMVIQKTDVCSIVRNEKEEFNVGAKLKNWKTAAGVLASGAVLTGGAVVAKNKYKQHKLNLWNRAKNDWAYYDTSITEDKDYISPHSDRPIMPEDGIPYIPIYEFKNGTRSGVMIINPVLVNVLPTINEAMKYDIAGEIGNATKAYKRVIDKITDECEDYVEDTDDYEDEVNKCYSSLSKVYQKRLEVLVKLDERTHYADAGAADEAVEIEIAAASDIGQSVWPGGHSTQYYGVEWNNNKKMWATPNSVGDYFNTDKEAAEKFDEIERQLRPTKEPEYYYRLNFPKTGEQNGNLIDY